jgi:hypothetical protein
MTEAYGAYGAEESHSRSKAIVLCQVIEHLGHLHAILSFNDWYNTEADWEQAIDQH